MSLVRRKIPHEVKEYESTMFFGLTTRQLICVAIMLCLVIPTILINNMIFHLSMDALGWIILVEGVPPAVCGWLKYNNMPVEQIAIKIFEFHFGEQKRKWKFMTTESRVLDAMIEIELDELTKERNEEIAEEKEREKQEKIRNKKLKIKKKEKKGKNKNA